MPSSRFWIAALALLLAATGVAAGDTLIRQAVHTGAMQVMGQTQPATDDTMTIWLATERAAISGGSTNAVFDFPASKFYVIDHASRTYSTLPIPLDLKALFPADDPQAAGILQMIDTMKLTAKVTPTTESRKIGSWNARLYRVEMTNPYMTMSSQTWATEDVQVDLARYAAMQTALLSLAPQMLEAARELEKVKGITVLEEQSISAMGAQMTIKRETLEIREAKAPEGTYAPPAGYALTPFDPLQGMRK
jgi:hypothetical protein